MDLKSKVKEIIKKFYNNKNISEEEYEILINNNILFEITKNNNTKQIGVSLKVNDQIIGEIYNDEAITSLFVGVNNYINSNNKLNEAKNIIDNPVSADEKKIEYNDETEKETKKKAEPQHLNYNERRNEINKKIDELTKDKYDFLKYDFEEINNNKKLKKNGLDLQVLEIMLDIGEELTWLSTPILELTSCEELIDNNILIETINIFIETAWKVFNINNKRSGEEVNIFQKNFIRILTDSQLIKNSETLEIAKIIINSGKLEECIVTQVNTYKRTIILEGLINSITLPSIKREKNSQNILNELLKQENFKTLEYEFDLLEDIDNQVSILEKSQSNESIEKAYQIKNEIPEILKTYLSVENEYEKRRINRIITGKREKTAPTGVSFENDPKYIDPNKLEKMKIILENPAMPEIPLALLDKDLIRKNKNRDVAKALNGNFDLIRIFNARKNLMGKNDISLTEKYTQKLVDMTDQTNKTKDKSLY